MAIACRVSIRVALGLSYTKNKPYTGFIQAEIDYNVLTQLVKGIVQPSMVILMYHP